MKIQLQNVGTIKNSTFDLSKNLIILCGPNNTGKTYAAYSIYGACERIKEHIHYIHNILYESMLNITTADELTYSIDTKELLEECNTVVSPSIMRIELDFFSNLFATNAQKFKTAHINIEFDIAQIKKTIARNNKFLIHDVLLELDLNESETAIIIKTAEYSFKKNKNTLDLAFYIAISQLLSLKAQIFTAERAAINLFSKELSIKRNELIDELLSLKDKGKDLTSTLNSKAQRYPLPIKDNLEVANDLANLQKTDSPFAYLGEMIEQEILGGRITATPEGEMEFVQGKKNKAIGLHLSGSMVKSLSNLVFYFKHRAIEGDFIIIDEPELNLHPDNQCRVAKMLVRIVNAGFKVMISTHSDYIIRELNNLIMLHKNTPDTQRIMQKYGYQANDVLNPQDATVYLFTDTVSELPVSELGFSIPTIDAEINQLNNRAEEIYYTLHNP
jgi:predicted ATP-dependent endonuclease of OLD family